jgi:hypothetical protein
METAWHDRIHHGRNRQDEKMIALNKVAPAFVKMAHQIVWCTAATVDAEGRPRSRVLHPLWQWDGRELTGWIATNPTPVKRAHLRASPYMSCNYWAPSQDTCVWRLFATAPAPVGYDPTMIAAFESPTSPNFAALRLEPWRLRVFPGTLLLGKGGDILTWTE